MTFVNLKAWSYSNRRFTDTHEVSDVDQMLINQNETALSERAQLDAIAKRQRNNSRRTILRRDGKIVKGLK